MIPTRNVRKALALPLKSEFTMIVVMTWKPGIAPPTAPSVPATTGWIIWCSSRSSSSPATNDVAATLA